MISGGGGADTVACALDSVTFGYSLAIPVIRSASIDIRRGKVFAMLGRNGSGKTTLLKLIAGALKPQAGDVKVRGRVGLVPQLTQVNFAYSVLDMVLMGRARQIGLFATPTASDERAAAAALDRLGLLDLAPRSFDTLSGGERQLVLFARALASEAEMMVLDEPTASLDLAHQLLVLQHIRQLSRDHGITIVFSTHQLEHASAVADDVALLFGNGRIEAGSVAATTTADSLSELFGVEVRRAVIDGDLNQPGARRETFVPVWTERLP